VTDEKNAVFRKIFKGRQSRTGAGLTVGIRMRHPLIVGNWKMHNTVSESVSLVNRLKGLLSDGNCREIAVCPPFTALESVKHALPKRILLGAQNMHYETSGAFTGEISAGMLKDMGCTFVILGHSERRQIFGESVSLVGKKVSAALDANLTPILCVGETDEERSSDKTFKVIEEQLRGGLSGVEGTQAAGIVVAYEPVWAIGTGRTASPDDAQESHVFIRNILADLFGADTAKNVRILYGGSVKPENAKELMSQKDIDGALVGGAALKAESFAAIANY